MIKNIKNEGNIKDKITNTTTNHISNFSTAGPSLPFGAGMMKIGGRIGTSCKTRMQSESQGKQESGLNVRGLESEQSRERPWETPGRIS